MEKDTMIWAALGVVLLVFIGSTFFLIRSIDALGARQVAPPQVIQQAPQQIQVPTQTPLKTVNPGTHLEGNANAPVTIIEFSDFQCPFCERFFTQSYKQIQEAYIKTGKAKLYYKQFPLEQIHPYAKKAAEASECASDQGKFWEYHDLLFTNQASIDQSDVQKAVASLKAFGKQLGLDAAKFDACLDGGQKTAVVDSDIQEGLNVGVTGTPSFYINGQELVGAQPFSAFQRIIDPLLAK